MLDIPQELLTFDIEAKFEDIKNESPTDSLEEHYHSLARRLVARILGISNSITVGGVSPSDWDIYVGYDSIELIQTVTGFITNNYTSSQVGNLAGIDIYLDMNIEKYLEFRDKKSNVLSRIDLKNVQKFREEKLKDILDE